MDTQNVMQPRLEVQQRADDKVQASKQWSYLHCTCQERPIVANSIRVDVQVDIECPFLERDLLRLSFECEHATKVQKLTQRTSLGWGPGIRPMGRRFPADKASSAGLHLGIT